MKSINQELIIFLLFNITIFHIQSQVTIGTDAPPIEVSLLQIKDGATDVSPGKHQKGASYTKSESYIFNHY